MATSRTRAGTPAGPGQTTRCTRSSRVSHVLTFNAVDENTTEMTLSEYGYTTWEAHDQSKAGLEQVLDKLAASLANGVGAAGCSRIRHPLSCWDLMRVG